MSLFVIVNDNESEMRLFDIINFPYINIVSSFLHGLTLLWYSSILLPCSQIFNINENVYFETSRSFTD